MAKIISTLGDAITLINTLYELDSTPPTAGEEDYIVWTGLLNIAKNLWESEDGVKWKELFTTLTASADGDKTTVAGTYSYDLPALFKFPASGIVWLGSNANKTPIKVIKIEDLTIHENDTERWCYFTDTTLEFNPRAELPDGSTINYPFYKFASKLTTSTDLLEMSDPMAAIFYCVGELKKEEGDSTALQVFTQKIEAMKARNASTTWYHDDSLLNPIDTGFGV